MMIANKTFYIRIDGRTFTNVVKYKDYAISKGYANKVFQCIHGGEIMGIVVRRMRQESGLLNGAKYYGFKFVEWELQ